MSVSSKFRSVCLFGNGQTPGRQTVREFSSATTLLSRRQVLVELRDDVKGLGQLHDRMLINPGRARNELVPTGSARMIPWKRGSERTRLLASARGSPSTLSGVAMAEKTQNRLGDSLSTGTPSSILNILHNLPPSLTFQRRTTSPDTDTIHGSLTLGDIEARLLDDHGLRNQDVELSWTGEPTSDGRLRQLGDYDCMVRVRGHGQETMPLGIQIIRLNK